MIEQPNFEYKYDLALWKSFAARLSLAILIIAAGVFLVAMLVNLYFSQEKVKEETALKARTQLHDAVMDMRLMECAMALRGDTADVDDFLGILKKVKPYRHSFTLMTDAQGQFVHVGDSAIFWRDHEEAGRIGEMMQRGAAGMEEVFKHHGISLLIHEPVGTTGYNAAIVCSRRDILASYTPLLVYGAVAFFIGLVVLFSICTITIYHMVKPLHLFTESARLIAEGNLDAPLPVIKSQDELLQLHDSFSHMQVSLKKYIEDLKVTTATKEHMTSELAIAHDIQMGMIPTRFPQRDDVDLYASLKPAKEVGGDLYDFIFDNDELFVIVGDVAGKGVPASLYMAVTRTLFRNLAGNFQSACNIVREINKAIVSDNDSCLFVTLFVGVLDFRTRLMTYCNASHNAPLVVDEDGKSRYLEVVPNVPVGLVEHYDYVEQYLEFKPGMALLLYTDGLTEAMDKERHLFGEQRLQEALHHAATLPSEDIVTHIQRQVAGFIGEADQSDDLTMLCMRYRAPENAVAGKRHIRLKNELYEVGRLKSFIFSLCKEIGADDSFTIGVNLAVEEAVANVIKYAYPKGARGYAEIDTHVEDNCLVFVIVDEGKPFDPTKREAPDITQGVQERPVGGLGIHLVRNIMDEMTYKRDDKERNILTLKKKIIYYDNSMDRT